MSAPTMETTTKSLLLSCTSPDDGSCGAFLPSPSGHNFSAAPLPGAITQQNEALANFSVFHHALGLVGNDKTGRDSPDSILGCPSAIFTAPRPELPPQAAVAASAKHKGLLLLCEAAQHFPPMTETEDEPELHIVPAYISSAAPKTLGVKEYDDRDEAIRCAVKETGQQPGEPGFDWKWIQKSKHMKGYGDMSIKQLNERWINYAAPGIRRGRWTETEHALLFKLADSPEFGRSWTKIAAALGNRSPNDCKNRYHSNRNRAGNAARVKKADDDAFSEPKSKSARKKEAADDEDYSENEIQVQCSCCLQWHVWPAEFAVPGDDEDWTCEMHPINAMCRHVERTQSTTKQVAKTTSSTKTRGPGRPPKASQPKPKGPKGR